MAHRLFQVPPTTNILKSHFPDHSFYNIGRSTGLGKAPATTNNRRRDSRGRLQDVFRPSVERKPRVSVVRSDRSLSSGLPKKGRPASVGIARPALTGRHRVQTTVFYNENFSDTDEQSQADIAMGFSSLHQSVPQSSATLKGNVSIPASQEVSVFRAADSSVEIDMGTSIFNQQPPFTLKSLREVTEKMRIENQPQPRHQSSSLQYVQPKTIGDEQLASMPSTAREECRVETFREHEQDENQNSNNMVMTETPAELMMKRPTPKKQHLVGSEKSSDAQTVHMNQTYRGLQEPPLSQKVESRKNLLERSDRVLQIDIDKQEIKVVEKQKQPPAAKGGILASKQSRLPETFSPPSRVSSEDRRICLRKERNDPYCRCIACEKRGEDEEFIKMCEQNMSEITSKYLGPQQQQQQQRLAANSLAMAAVASRMSMSGLSLSCREEEKTFQMNDQKPMEHEIEQPTEHFQSSPSSMNQFSVKCQAQVQVLGNKTQVLPSTFFSVPQTRREKRADPSPNCLAQLIAPDTRETAMMNQTVPLKQALSPNTVGSQPIAPTMLPLHNQPPPTLISQNSAPPLSVQPPKEPKREVKEITKIIVLDDLKEQLRQQQSRRVKHCKSQEPELPNLTPREHLEPATQYAPSINQDNLQKAEAFSRRKSPVEEAQNLRQQLLSTLGNFKHKPPSVIANRLSPQPWVDQSTSSASQPLFTRVRGGQSTTSSKMESGTSSSLTKKLFRNMKIKLTESDQKLKYSKLIQKYNSKIIIQQKKSPPKSTTSFTAKPFSFEAAQYEPASHLKQFIDSQANSRAVQKQSKPRKPFVVLKSTKQLTVPKPFSFRTHGEPVP